jgi:hypothetical protein
MTDKKIICKEEPPVKVGDNDTSDGTKPIRLWDFLRVMSPSRAYIAIKRCYGDMIYEGMVPEYGDPKDLYKKDWDALLTDESTKQMQVVDVHPYATNYGDELRLRILVEDIEDEEDWE